MTSQQNSTVERKRRNSLQISIQFILVFTAFIAAFVAGRYTTIRFSERQVQEAHQAQDRAEAQAEHDLQARIKAEAQVSNLRRQVMRANRLIEETSKRNDSLQDQLRVLRESQPQANAKETVDECDSNSH